MESSKVKVGALEVAEEVGEAEAKGEAGETEVEAVLVVAADTAEPDIESEAEADAGAEAGAEAEAAVEAKVKAGPEAILSLPTIAGEAEAVFVEVTFELEPAAATARFLLGDLSAPCVWIVLSLPSV